MTAEHVFGAAGSRLRVLTAGPGHGKSTLLRHHLASACRHLPQRGTDTARTADAAAVPDAVPVLVHAAGLIASPLLALALATAVTAALGPFGLREALTEDFFRRRPHPDAPWLVMIDGLDEVPDRTTRLSLLDRLSREAGQKDSPYRFLIATRPLPRGELERLGPTADHFGLRPYTDADVRTYAEKRFSGLPDADRHVRTFTNGILRTRLDGLARIPLMAAMLCHLYTADVDQPLPEGRTGVYRSFVELLYEQNVHKRVGVLHDEAINALTSRYQIPQDRRAVQGAAERARENLPRLIDHLAHERIGGNPDPATEILAAHPLARCPAKVKPPLWHALLADLLRATGLLVGQGDDVDFLHRTLLEYHAARHVTGDDQARVQLLHRLFHIRRLRDRLPWAARPGPAAGQVDPLDLDASYLGFLLDALLVPGDSIATATLRALEGLVAPPGITGYHLLKAQLQLGSSFPRQTTARWLTVFADSPVLDDRSRVEAAWDLAELDGHPDEGARLLARLARDRSLDSYGRGWAADVLAGLDGHREAGAALLVQLALDPAMAPEARILAARDVSRLDAHEGDGARLLTEFATAAGTEDDLRSEAAAHLAELDGFQEAAAGILLGIAQYGDVTAAAYLAGMEGPQREDGIGLLAAFTADPDGDPNDRVRAAQALAEVDGCRARAIELLTDFAREAVPGSHTLLVAVEALAEFDGERAAELALPVALGGRCHPHNRLRALHVLAYSPVHQGKAARPLAAHAADPAAEAHHRVDAARTLASLDGHREGAVALLGEIAENTAVDPWDRMLAAAALAELGEDRSAALLTAFVADPALRADARVQAARALAQLDGHRAAGIRLLSAFADDTASGAAVSRNAAVSLTTLGLYRIRR
ncbi:ATP-binding protein [Streptomyces sp. G-G2]|uniref:NACHT domain-containing protein n=1 Tax=Streptomyces sp. G-G2 TaxID=3046201 RepID=UPI0024BA23ED|nr:ATP-binding protein [Streptomyces sp. G-G2]MDJ0385295.1 ATP-binding protein [Streptomyces sp. G-G2]